MLDSAMLLQLQKAAMLNSMYASTALPSESALIEELEQVGDALVETIDSGVDQLIQWFESQNLVSIFRLGTEHMTSNSLPLLLHILY